MKLLDHRPCYSDGSKPSKWGADNGPIRLPRAAFRIRTNIFWIEFIYLLRWNIWGAVGCHEIGHASSCGFCGWVPVIKTVTIFSGHSNCVPLASRETTPAWCIPNSGCNSPMARRSTGILMLSRYKYGLGKPGTNQISKILWCNIAASQNSHHGPHLEIVWRNGAH